jgi:hypothetical protein
VPNKIFPLVNKSDVPIFKLPVKVTFAALSISRLGMAKAAHVYILVG